MVDMARNQRARWAGKICVAWRSSIEAVFECGRLLIAAKDALDHGEFTKMVEHDLPFGERTAQRLMAIARDTRLTNPTHASLLPQSWMTLYELSKLPNHHFATAIADGLITPELRRTDIADMMARWEYAERRASTSSFEPATEPAPISLTGQTAHPFRYAPAPPLPPDAADHSALTVITLSELAPVHAAKLIVEALLILDRDGAQCRDLSVVVNLLLGPANADKLDRVRRGIAFAVRLKGALDHRADDPKETS
jgi:hypothetical protein